MGYREFVPAAALRGIVECAWTATVDVPHVQSVLPDGCMDLIQHTGAVLVTGPDTATHPARQRSVRC